MEVLKNISDSDIPFNIPLYYISFKKKPDKEKHFKNVGFNDIRHFKAVDGRKLDPVVLLKQKIIGPRAYDDLKIGRSEHSGISTLGAIGCTLSHYSLWQECVKRRLPYICIMEEDNSFYRKIYKRDIENIKNAIQKPYGMFVSSNIKNEYGQKKHFFGTHFYIASNSACKKLIRNAFPIETQVDWYIPHLDSIGEIQIEGYVLSAPDKASITSTQDVCVKCILPKNVWFYIFIIVIIAIIVSILIFKKCKKM